MNACKILFALKNRNFTSHLCRYLKNKLMRNKGKKGGGTDWLPQWLPVLITWKYIDSIFCNHFLKYGIVNTSKLGKINNLKKWKKYHNITTFGFLYVSHYSPVPPHFSRAPPNWLQTGTMLNIFYFNVLLSWWMSENRRHVCRILLFISPTFNFM